MALGRSWTNIASGSFELNQATLTFYIDAKLNSQSTSDNQSVIDTRMWTDFSGNQMGGAGYSFSCTGCSTVSGSGVYWYGDETIATGQVTVSHGSDGEKRWTMSGACTNSYLGMNISISGSIDLPTIPRQSTPAITPTTVTLDGSAITINTRRASSSFTHTIVLSTGSWTNTLYGVGASATYTLPVSDLMPLMTTPTRKVTVKTKTYSGSTQIGSETTTSFTIKVDTSTEYARIAGYTLSDTNTATSAVEASGTFIRGASNLRLDMQIAAHSAGSNTSLRECTVTCGEVTQTTVHTGTSANVLFECPKVTASEIHVTITDSHGNSFEQAIALTLVNYQPVAIQTATATRVNDQGDPSDTGTFVKFVVSVIWFQGSFGQSDNALDLSYEYKEPDASAYTQGGGWAYITTGEGGVTTYTFEKITPSTEVYSESKQYDFKLTVSDMFSSEEYVLRVHEGLPIAGWGEDHFDVYGSLYVHDRNNLGSYTKYGLNTKDSKTDVTLSAYGYITSGGEKAVIYIPMNMLPGDNTKTEITKLNVSMRHIGGDYLVSNGASLRNEIESFYPIPEQSVLRVVTYRSGGYGITNNTPINGEVTISYREIQS